MFIPILNKTALVKRRTGGASGTGASLNEYNDKSYGDPSTWTTVYSSLPCRLEILKQPIQFKETGERTNPTNIMYVQNDAALQTEDRITIDSVTYIAQGIIKAFDPIGNIDHYEVELIVEP